MADQVRSASGGWVLRVLLLVSAGLVVLAWRLLMPTDAEHSIAPTAADAQTAEPSNPNIAFEPGDWSLAPVAATYVGLLALLAISAFVLMAAYPHALPDVGRGLRIAPPGPRLQTNAPGDLWRFRADEERRLNTYYWVDKGAGLVHIPIEQAMKQLATTGIPDFPKAQQ